jgi:hypothetical protein
MWYVFQIVLVGSRWDRELDSSFLAFTRLWRCFVRPGVLS